MKYLKNIKTMNSLQNALYSNINQAVSSGFPEELTLTTTLRCNYRCRMCYQQEFKSEMEWALVNRIQEILPFVTNMQIFGGEPLAYKRIHDLYRLAQANKCNITMISNGSLLDEKMCQEIVNTEVHHIKFSIDAGTPKTYKFIRGGDFMSVITGIARISKYKARKRTHFPDMHFNFLLMRNNMAELSTVVEIAANIGISTVNVFFPSCNTEEIVDLCVYFCQEEADEHMRAAKAKAAQLGVILNIPPFFGDKDSNKAQANPAEKTKCSDPWTKFLINVKGDVNLCCGGPTTIGNLLESSFDELWNCEKAQHLRKTVNTADEPDYCKICRVRKPAPHSLDMHIPNKKLQIYAREKFAQVYEQV